MASLRKNWFLIVLMSVLLVGFRQSGQLAGLASVGWLKWAIVSITIFLMAWPLEFTNIRQALGRPAASILASLINVVGIPLMVWPIWKWFGPEMGGGMVVAAATPCTLAAAAIWTRRAGGNDCVAILVTLLTNLTCFLVMPFWIYIVTGGSVGPEQLVATIYKLFGCVVLPITMAQILRWHRPMADWATHHKPSLSTLAMFGILSMVLIGAVNMGIRMSEQQQIVSGGTLLLVGLTMLTVHSVAWAVGWNTALAMKLPKKDCIAVGFAGSQKTLMVGLTVAISLQANIIPIVLYHAIQLILDTLIADRLSRQVIPEI